MPKAPTERADRSDDPRWQLAQRIAASGSLGRSRLMAEFLLYVVDRHILDRGDEITEQQIGVLVFGRPDGYDSNEDNIVRSYARNLRKRLEEYFSGEGSHEPLRMEIPRGGYVPQFFNQLSEKASGLVESVEGSDSEEEYTLGGVSVLPNAEDIAETETRDNRSGLSSAGWFKKPKAKRLWNFALPAFLVGMLLGIGGAFLLSSQLFKRTNFSPAAAMSHTLWTQLFSKEQDTFIVPSDDGLIIMQGLTERPVPLASYVNGSYRTNLKIDNSPGAPEILKLGARRYTSVVDLDFVAHLGQLEEAVPARMMIRYARDLRMEDLRVGNAILIGSIEANPWIELFQPQMNFRFTINAGTNKPSGILNAQPRAGEQKIYGTPDPNHTYGLITYVPNLTSTGHVLIVGGLNTAGTEAATTFLLTPSLMMPILQRAKMAHGGLQRFELLIGAGSFAANASAPQLILERIGAS
ncbi:hypothetical protein [Terriglobus saanensis]|uniref:hypothetical protein n=1 Tax=Terriglobus saanensis TaxID=870903 RepID=UPI001185BDC7|nr:hypothetical protein [Terriglobus saanensis]